MMNDIKYVVINLVLFFAFNCGTFLKASDQKLMNSGQACPNQFAARDEQDIMYGLSRIARTMGVQNLDEILTYLHNNHPEIYCDVMRDILRAADNERKAIIDGFGELGITNKRRKIAGEK